MRVSACSDANARCRNVGSSTRFALTQPNASRQLGILKNAGVVASRREGTWTYHKLAAQPDSDCERLLQALVRGFASQGTLKKDVERLVNVRGPAACR